MDILREFGPRFRRCFDYLAVAGIRNDLQTIQEAVVRDLVLAGWDVEVLEPLPAISHGDAACNTGPASGILHLATTDRTLWIDILFYPDRDSLDRQWSVLKSNVPDGRTPGFQANANSSNRNGNFFFCLSEERNSVAGTILRGSTTVINAGVQVPVPIPKGLDTDPQWSPEERARRCQVLAGSIAALESVTRTALQNVVAEEDLAWFPGEGNQLSVDERLAGFLTLWSEVKYNFVSFDQVPDLDWDLILRQYLPLVRAEQTDEEYYRLLQQCMALLNDGHTQVYVFEPNAIPPVRLEPIDGRILVMDVDPSHLPSPSLATRGMELTHVDGKAVDDLIRDEIAPLISASTPQDRERKACAKLLQGESDTTITLTLKSPEGISRDVLLPRLNRRQITWVRKRGPNFEYRDLGNAIAYVAVRTYSDASVVDEFEKVMPNIRAAKGLIIDVRDNGGGSSGYGNAIIARLTDKALPGTHWKTRDYRPAFRAWEREEQWYEGDNQVRPQGTDPYLGPIVVLIGPTTASAAEDFLIPLHASKRATLVGERTAGTTGQPLMIELPGICRARICTKRDTYPDGREFVGVGVMPDVEIHPTQADVVAGNDPVLNKGIELLRNRRQFDQAATGN